MRSFEYFEGAEKRTCEYKPCGKTFYFKQSPTSYEAGLFCSRVCFRAWQKENKGKIKYINSPITKKKQIVNPILHRKYAIQWQDNNPKKVKAQGIAKYYKDDLIIIYECRCDDPRKHNHHFNYSLPLVVIRLCPLCHGAEHKRLRSLPTQPQPVSAA